MLMPPISERRGQTWGFFLRLTCLMSLINSSQIFHPFVVLRVSASGSQRSAA
jgi:hypothetical protein